MSNHNKHSEWVLELAIQIDERSAGFCGSLLRASAEKRHVWAAFLAARPDALENPKEVAQLLWRADHRTILKEAHGEAPQGLRGALRRSGPAVHEQRFYTVLHKLLSKPRHDAIKKCISRFEALDLTKLRVANILPEPICRPNVVEAIDSVGAAGDLIASIKLLTGAGADEHELLSAMRDIRDAAALAEVVKRVLLKCSAPEHPVAEAEGYRPIRSAHELHRIASKYRNCARNYTVELLDSEAGHAFAEVSRGREGAVAHLRKRDGRWRLEGLFGPRNFAPSRSVRDYAREHLERHGVEPRERDRSDTKWSPVRRITTSHFYELDFE